MVCFRDYLGGLTDWWDTAIAFWYIGREIGCNSSQEKPRVNIAELGYLIGLRATTVYTSHGLSHRGRRISSSVGT